MEASLRTRIRVGDVEIDVANDELAIEWYERLRPHIEANGALGRPSKAKSISINTGEVTEPSLPSIADGGPALSEISFGQFYHRFRPNATDVDRMLIAGYFLEETSETRTFTTAAANNLLKDQGVKVTNASESLRRNLALRRVFKQGGREFRISRPAGKDQLRSLLADGASLE